MRSQLFEARDTGYGDFTASLIPTIDKSTVIGVRVPFLRKYAKSMPKEDACAFMQRLPHAYLEENYLHAFLISLSDDYESAISETERFLPYIDNWAVCDGMRPKVFSRNTDRLFEKIKEWIGDRRTYTVRYGVGMLHAYYLGEAFEPSHLALAASASCDDYYINMMIAWYFATALAKQKETTLAFIESGALPDAVHNLTLRKACESLCFDKNEKEYFRSLRRRARA